MIKTVFIIVYLYGLLPLLIGSAICLFMRSLFRFSSLYVVGYVCYLAVFSIVIMWELNRQTPYTRIAHHWAFIIGFLTLFSLLLIAAKVLWNHKKHNRESKTTNHITYTRQISRDTCIIFALTICLIVLAIVFLVPNAYDETPELARLTLSSNAVFSIDPASGNTYSASSALPGCIHLFYSIGSTLSGVNVVTLIHLIIPIFLIPLLICSYIIVARLLFSEKGQDKNRFYFVLLVILFYLLMLPLEAHVAFSPYRNIWNGTTLASSCLIPLLFSVCLALARYYTEKPYCREHTTNAYLLETIGAIALLSLSIKLCVPYGVVVSALFVLATCIIITVSALLNKGGEKS